MSVKYCFLEKIKYCYIFLGGVLKKKLNITIKSNNYDILE